MCHCAVVSDEQVVGAVDSGARTLGQVCRATKAGQDCGMCVFTLKQLICKHEELTYSTLLEVEGAAS